MSTCKAALDLDVESSVCRGLLLGLMRSISLVPPGTTYFCTVLTSSSEPFTAYLSVPMLPGFVGA